VAALALSGLVLGLGTADADGSQGAAQGVRLTYLGAAGWEITDGRLIVLVDPYLTRAKYGTPIDDVAADDPRPEVTNSTVVKPDTAVIDRHVKRADIILVTHTHPDHALDVPYIARKTRALVVGTESTVTLARASGVPAHQLRIVTGRDVLDFEDVTIRVIPSLHGIFRRPSNPSAPPRQPPVIPADAKAPFQYAQHAEGGTLAYLIRIGGQQILVFGSMNFIEQEIAGLRPTVALIGAMPERANIDDYTGRLMRALGQPRTVIPTHWDRFNVPFGYTQQPARDRLQSFIAEVKAASPATKVVVPEHFKPILIDSAGVPVTGTH
jgi:L-ascorbate metabolism protein UlaG (beta-lactamase superfamily)